MTWTLGVWHSDRQTEWLPRSLLERHVPLINIKCTIIVNPIVTLESLCAFLQHPPPPIVVFSVISLVSVSISPWGFFFPPLGLLFQLSLLVKYPKTLWLTCMYLAKPRWSLKALSGTFTIKYLNLYKMCLRPRSYTVPGLAGRQYSSGDKSAVDSRLH